MPPTWNTADDEFRDEVRAFLDAALDDDLRRVGRSMTSVYADYEPSMAWQKLLHRKGWVAPAWPPAYGGCGWSATRRYIWAVETALAGAPPISPMGIGMCGPVLIGHGSPEQKARFLPPMLSGDEFWCQGYSEPGAGSDLASLQMTARDAGDHFVCNGHKIWTTHANRANWIFCLARTSVEARPQRGISFLLIDMTTPGVEVKPIVSLSGEHIQNEVFFTDVAVPKSNVVGEVGNGWAVAKYLMQFERGGSVTAPGLRVRLDRVATIVSTQEGLDAEKELIALKARLAAASIRVDALEAMELRVLARLSQGQAPGEDSSMMKIVSTELSQHLTELALEATGLYASAYQPHLGAPGGPIPFHHAPPDGFAAGPDYSWTVSSKYLNDRAGSIYAGTNEIQRNIIAKAVLRL